MFNLLKFPFVDKSNIFFISDLHYGHEKLVESRGFSSLEEHNKTIINNWNDVVGDDSVVFCLGDTVLGAGEKSGEVFNNLLSSLKYKELYLMGGNHTAFIRSWFNNNIDGKVDKYYRLEVKDSKDRKVFLIPNYYEIFVGGKLIIMSHYAVLSWRDQSHGSFMLFGHSHDSLKKNKWINDNYLVGKCIDVGFEAFQKPLSFNEITDILNSKAIVSVDHHDSNTSRSI